MILYSLKLKFTQYLKKELRIYLANNFRICVTLQEVIKQLLNTDLKQTFTMTDSTFRLDFHQRRLLNSSSKTYYYVAGVVGFAVGIFGLTKSIDGLNELYLILLITGILNILFAINGKCLIKEKNFILISSDNIEFKNSFQKPKKLRLDNMLDIRFEAKNIEFILNDQQLRKYDFTIFSDGEIERLFDEIKSVKSRINE